MICFLEHTTQDDWMLEDLAQHCQTTLPTESDVFTNTGNSPLRREKPEPSRCARVTV